MDHCTRLPLAAADGSHDRQVAPSATGGDDQRVEDGEGADERGEEGDVERDPRALRRARSRSLAGTCRRRRGLPSSSSVRNPSTSAPSTSLVRMTVSLLATRSSPPSDLNASSCRTIPSSVRSASHDGHDHATDDGHRLFTAWSAALRSCHRCSDRDWSSVADPTSTSSGPPGARPSSMTGSMEPLSGSVPTANTSFQE